MSVVSAPAASAREAVASAPADCVAHLAANGFTDTPAATSVCRVATVDPSFCEEVLGGRGVARAVAVEACRLAATAGV
ncbi:hypothetical protein GCM10022243_45470 [Saccharothrix violaceirubra]